MAGSVGAATEIARLVTRFFGDISDYQKKLKQMEKETGEAARRMEKEKFGVFGKGGAAAGIAIGAVGAAYAVAANIAQGFIKHTEEMRELAHKKQLNRIEEENHAYEKQNQLVMEGFQRQRGGDKSGALGGHLALAKTALEDRKRLVMGKEKEIEEYLKSRVSIVSDIFDQFRPNHVKKLNQELDEMRKRVNPVRSQVEGLETALRQWKNSLEDVERGLEDSLYTMGMTAEEARVYRKQIEGATAAETAHSWALVEADKRGKELVESRTQARDFTRDLRQQTAQQELWNAGVEMGSNFQRAFTIGIKETSEALKLQLLYEGKLADLKEKGKTIRMEMDERFRPEKGLNKQYKELNELLQAGEITQDEYYSKALQYEDKYREKIHGSLAALAKFDSVLSKSTEARVRVAEYMDRLGPGTARRPTATGDATSGVKGIPGGLLGNEALAKEMVDLMKKQTDLLDKIHKEAAVRALPDIKVVDP